MSGHSDVPSLSWCGPTGQVVLAGVYSLGVVEIELTYKNKERVIVIFLE